MAPAVDNHSILMWRNLNLEEAYMYTREQIYQYLNDVADKPGEFFKYEDPAEKGKILKDIRNQILRLSRHITRTDGEEMVDGIDYSDKTLAPSQHIRRKRSRPGFEKSSFLVSPYPHDYPQNEAKKKMDYCSPYDLLGLFFFHLGPAPVGADRARFYLPLTGVYGRWCCRITGHPDLEYKSKIMRPAQPFMLQCTWMPVSLEKGKTGPHNLFLGASLGGLVKKGAAPWHMEVALFRYKLIWSLSTRGSRGLQSTAATFAATELQKILNRLTKQFKKLPLDSDADLDRNTLIVQRIIAIIVNNYSTIAGFPQYVRDPKPAPKDGTDERSVKRNIEAMKQLYNDKPTLQAMKKCQKAINPLLQIARKIIKNPAVKFGNCAETYPWMNLFREATPAQVNQAEGFALEMSTVEGKIEKNNAGETAGVTWDRYNDWNNSPFWGHIREPCGNCAWLLSSIGRTTRMKDKFNPDLVFQSVVDRYQPEDDELPTAIGTL